MDILEVKPVENFNLKSRENDQKWTVITAVSLGRL